LRIKSTVALAGTVGGAEGAGEAAVDVDGDGDGDAAFEELAALVDRRTFGEAGAALTAVESVGGAPEIVVPAAATAALPVGLSAVERASLVLGGGGGMSRAGPLVGSKVGAAEASVVAAVVSELEVAPFWPLTGGPETAAATSTPRIDITKSSPAQGNHVGSARLWPGMIAVGMSRPARSAARAERTSGFERRLSRW